MTRSARPFLPLSLGLALAAVLPAGAQPAGRPGAAQTSVTFETAYTGNTPFEAGNRDAGAASVLQFGAKVSAPLPSPAARTVATWTLSYRDYSIERDAGTPIPDRFKSVSTSVSAVRLPVDDWSFFGSLGVGLHQAGNGFSSRGFGVSAIGLANRNFRPDLTGGIGFAYNSLSRRRGRVLPVATLDWKPAKDWRAFVGFPRTGAIWQATPEIDVEAVVEADFGSFYVKDDPAPAAAARPPLDRTRLDWQALRVGPAVNWRFAPAASLRLAAGLVPMLEVEYRQRGYKLEADRLTGFASAALEWRF